MTFFYIGLAALALMLLSKRGEICVMFGQRHFGNGNFDKARKMFDLAEKMGGASFNSRVIIGFLYFKMGDYEVADKLFRQLRPTAKSNDQRMRLKMSHALVKWRRGDVAEAIEMLEEVISKYKNTSAYGSLGLIYLLDNQLEKALDFNKEAYDYNKDDAIIVDNLAYNYYLLGDYDNADKYYEETFALKPRFPEPYFYYAKLKAEAHADTSAAIEYLETCLTKNFNANSTITVEQVQEYLDNLKQSS